MTKFKQLLGVLIFLSAAIFTITDIAFDVALARKYYFHSKTPPWDLAWILFCLTALWIGLGGALQAIIVFVYLCRRHPSLEPLPTTIRFLLCISAPFLMAPVITSLFGAYLIIRDRGNVEEDVIKYATFCRCSCNS